MKIHDIHLYAVQGGPAPGGKRRPMAFGPYCLIEGFPAIPANLPYRVVETARLFDRQKRLQAMPAVMLGYRFPKGGSG